MLLCLQDIPSTGLDCWYQLEARTQRSNVQGRIRLKLWLSTREDRGNSEEDNWSEIRQQERLHAIFISYELDHSSVRHLSFYAFMFSLSLFLIQSFLIIPLLTWSMNAAFCSWEHGNETAVPWMVKCFLENWFTTSFSKISLLIRIKSTILVHKSQQDTQVTEFILTANCSTCFGRHYHPSSGAQNNCNYRIL
jgi:hypothetical protein